MSTHSTHLVCNASPQTIRVLRRRQGSFAVHRLSADSLADTARFRRFVARPFAEFFFARLVVFGDGAAERDALPVLLASALGADPSSLGVTVVDCESMGNPQVPKLMAAANELGLPWIVFVDNDPAGGQAVSAIVDPDTNAPMTLASNRVVIAGSKAIEQLLIDAGYGDEVNEVAAYHGETLSTEKEQLRFMARHKGWVGEAVVSLALRNGKSVPASVAALALRIEEMLASSEPPEINGALP